MNNDQSNKLDIINKLQSTLESREKQIKSMAEMLAELNDKLNDTLIKSQNLVEENKELQKRLALKEVTLQQELKDKEIIFSKLQTIERERERLAEKLISLEEKPAKENKTNKAKSKFTFIETSKGKLQSETINNENALANHNNALSPIKVITPETMRKQESSGSEKGIEDDEDVLERIRRNLQISPFQKEH